MPYRYLHFGIDNARQPTQTLTDTNDPEPDAGEGESLAHAAAAHAAPPERAHHVVHGAWGACAARASWLGVRVRARRPGLVGSACIQAKGQGQG